MRGKNTSSKAAGIALSVSLSVAAVAAATTSEAGESQVDATAAVASEAMLEGRGTVAVSRSVHRTGSASSALAPRQVKKLSARERQKLRGKRLKARDRAALKKSRAVKRSTARALGRHMADVRGWDGRQWRCLDNLWIAESNWQPRAANGGSGAYGIPQALPGHKMSSHGGNWRLSARTQIKWGLSYIDGRYDTPCGAYNHFRARNWY